MWLYAFAGKVAKSRKINELVRMVPSCRFAVLALLLPDMWKSCPSLRVRPVGVQECVRSRGGGIFPLLSRLSGVDVGCGCEQEPA